MSIWWITTETLCEEAEAMPKHNPPHPGEVIRELCLEPLGLSVIDAAKGLGATRKALSELLNGDAGISPEMAIRLERAFGTRRRRGSKCSWSMISGKRSSGPAISKSRAL
jgi:addiction module HigA family antidote